MKKLFAVLLTVALVLSMSAVAFAAEDGKITIWTWDPNFNIASMKIGAEMYQKDHPDVEIEIQEVASDDIETAVAQAAVAGNLDTLPDIMLCQDNSFQKMVANYPEVYTDITDMYDFEGFGEEDYEDEEELEGEEVAEETEDAGEENEEVVYEEEE